jgi:hypothetical protein
MSSFLKDPKAVAPVAAALVAAIATLTALYFSTRAQRALATKQEGLQRELIGQQAILQREIESAKDMLERARSFDTLTRDRIISRLDGALSAYGLLSAYAYLVGRYSWVRRQGPAVIEDKVQCEAASLRSGLEFLRFMGAMPESVYEPCASACSRVSREWGLVMGDLRVKDGDHSRDEKAEQQAFSTPRFNERHGELRDATNELGKALFESLTRMDVPR